MSSCSDAAVPGPGPGHQSELNLSTVILVSLVAGAALFLVNTVILGTATLNTVAALTSKDYMTRLYLDCATVQVFSVCSSVSLCYKRSGPHRPRWDRAGERVDTSTECLNSGAGAGAGSGPTTPHLLPTFSTPGRPAAMLDQASSTLCIQIHTSTPHIPIQ